MTVESKRGRVETRAADAAVVVTGKPVNHVQHLLLSLFLCAIWIRVWHITAVFGAERRVATATQRFSGSRHIRCVDIASERSVMREGPP
jgi:hypothetical protein